MEFCEINLLNPVVILLPIVIQIIHVLFSTEGTVKVMSSQNPVLNLWADHLNPYLLVSGVVVTSFDLSSAGNTDNLSWLEHVEH